MSPYSGGLYSGNWRCRKTRTREAEDDDHNDEKDQCPVAREKSPEGRLTTFSRLEESPAGAIADRAAP